MYDIKEQFKMLKELKDHKNKVNCVNFSYDSKYLASCSDDLTVKKYDCKEQFKLKDTINIADNECWICFVSFSNDSKYLAIC